MPEIIGNLGDELPRMYAWAKAQPIAELINTPFAVGRRECWYGTGIDTAGPTLLEGRDDPLVTELGARYLPGWNSGLLLEYGPGVGISPHVDPACFEEWAVTINLGEAQWIEGRADRSTSTLLHDGDVVRFRTTAPHGVAPVGRIRYSLLFRAILPQFTVIGHAAAR
jgi:hypothetical protein